MPEEKKHKGIECDECGVEMNYNAEKLDFTACLDDPDLIDPDLGGVLEEVHTCPHCGKTELFKAQAAQ